MFLGKPLKGKNLAEILTDADLNWNPIKAKTPNPFLLKQHLANGMSWDEASKASESRYEATFRSDTFQQIGAVKSRYEPTSHIQLFEILEGITRNVEGAYFSSAGHCYGGEMVHATVTIPSKFNVAGVDPIHTGINFRTGHNGYYANEFRWLTYRQICKNGMMVLENEKCLRGKHTKTFNSKLADWKVLLEQSQLAFASLEEKFNLLASKTATAEAFAEFEKAMFGEEKKTEKGNLRENSRRLEFEAVYEINDGNKLPELKGTLWNVLNGITFMTSHGENRDGSKRYDEISHLMSTGAAYNQNMKAFTTLLELAKTAPNHIPTQSKGYSIPRFNPIIEDFPDDAPLMKSTVLN